MQFSFGLNGIRELACDTISPQLLNSRTGCHATKQLINDCHVLDAVTTKLCVRLDPVS